MPRGFQEASESACQLGKDTPGPAFLPLTAVHRLELITDPSVLFLDEPTTGLDSSTSYALVSTLQKLAMAGRTIISTIHQPSSDIFFMFDNVIMLAKGHILYNGMTETSS